MTCLSCKHYDECKERGALPYKTGLEYFPEEELRENMERAPCFEREQEDEK